MVTLIKQSIQAVIIGFSVAVSSFALAEYQPLDQVAVIVEDEVILASEIAERLVALKANLRQRGINLPSDEVLYEEVIEQQILESLQFQRAKQMGLRVSDQELNDALSRVAANNQLTLSEFREALLAQGQSYVQAREQIRKELLLNQVQQRNVFRSINISKAEIESFLSSGQGKALVQPEWKIEHLLLEVQDFSNEKDVSDKESQLKNLRSQAIAAGGFSTIDKVIRAANIAVQNLGWVDSKSIPTLFEKPVASLGAGEISSLIKSPSGFHLVRVAEVRGGAVEKVSETKVSHILITETLIRDQEQSKALINDVREKVINGEDFAFLARTHSEDPGSALSGGDLGWVSQGKMVPEFESMMLATGVGQVSEVFRTDYGWHFLKVLDRRESDAFKDYSYQIARRAIAENKYNDVLQNWLQELRDNAYVEIK